MFDSHMKVQGQSGRVVLPAAFVRAFEVFDQLALCPALFGGLLGFLRLWCGQLLTRIILFLICFPWLLNLYLDGEFMILLRLGSELLVFSFEILASLL